MPLRLTFAQLLSRNQTVVIDGGLATQLESQGCNIDGPLWSASLLQSNAAAIVAAHRAYLAAGANIIITASYQASRQGFAALGVGANDSDALIRSSVTLACEARAAFVREQPTLEYEPLVAASVGPYGAALHDGSEYTGDYCVDREQLRHFHAQRLALLDGSEADVLAVETIPSALEAQVLCDLLSDCEKPAWVSFSCKDSARICDGTLLADVATLFRGHKKVLALGVNCTPPEFVTSLVKTLRQHAPDMAVVAYPNSGEAYCAADSSWSGAVGAIDWAGATRDWVAAGATFIGGCCRTGPAQISAIARACKIR